MLSSLRLLPTSLQYERYQVGYDRVLNEELPDTSDPADGRFWKAGVAQGVTTNPYQKRLAISGGTQLKLLWATVAVRKLR